MGINFCELAFDRENRENFCLTKISRYTVSVQERLPNVNFLKLLLACQLVNEPCKLSQICTHITRYIVLQMCRVVWNMHDICVMHNRKTCVHGLPKLFVVQWLGLSVTGRGRGRVRDREWIFHFFS